MVRLGGPDFAAFLVVTSPELCLSYLLEDLSLTLEPSSGKPSSAVFPFTGRIGN